VIFFRGPFCFEQYRPLVFGMRVDRTDGGMLWGSRMPTRRPNICGTPSAVWRQLESYAIAKNEVSTARWRLSGSDRPS
jgi:hypothetical protein